MEKIMPVKTEGSLLARARACFDPEIFSHPVWVHFNRKEHFLSEETIQQLLGEAQHLQHENPRDACQVMLLCAAQQNLAGENANALRTTQQALAFSERTRLTREMIWTIWAACALCMQDNNYEQAARYLEYLQTVLSEGEEWVLADLIEVVKQSLRDSELAVAFHSPVPPDDGARNELISLIFDWLHQWGFPCHPNERNRRKNRLLTNSGISIFPSVLGGLRSSLAKWKLEGRAIKERSLPTQDSASPTFIHDSLSQMSVTQFNPPERHRPNCDSTAAFPVVVQMLGAFSITIQDTVIKLPSSRGLSLLKYLLFHHKQDIPREILMDIFWPESDPDASRNNLNVAMHSLRHGLRSAINVPIVRFEDGAYGLATNLDIWLDVEEFDQCIRKAKRLEEQNQYTAAVVQYEVAVNLYQQDFLADSPYEAWVIAEREQLQVAYLDTLDHSSRIYFEEGRYGACIAQGQRILARDVCREDIHCRLMKCYSRLGQSLLALRQYQICVEALRAELQLDPAPETIQLYQRVRRREPI